MSNPLLTDDEKIALATAATKVDALRNAIVNAASIVLKLSEVDDAFSSPKNRPIYQSTLNKAKNRKLDKQKTAQSLVAAFIQHLSIEVLPRPTRISAVDWARVCQSQSVANARTRALQSAQRFQSMLDKANSIKVDSGELANPQGEIPQLLKAPDSPRQELTDRLVRMWFFWGGHNAESDGERRFMIQLQFDTETDVVEGQNCEFRLNRCRLEVSCRQAQVRHDPEGEFQIEHRDSGSVGALVAIPDIGGFGSATSAGWSITSKDPAAPMHGKFNAEPFGVIEGTRMKGDSAKLYFRLRDLDVSGAKLPSDESGARLAAQWLRMRMIPSAAGGRVEVSAQELSDDI